MVGEHLVQQGFRVSKICLTLAAIFWCRSVEPGYLRHNDTYQIPWKRVRAQGYCHLEGSASRPVSGRDSEGVVNSVVPRGLEVGLQRASTLPRSSDGESETTQCPRERNQESLCHPDSG